MSSPDFWSDSQRAQKVSMERNRIEREISSVKDVEEKVEEVEVLIEMAEEEDVKLPSLTKLKVY